MQNFLGSAKNTVNICGIFCEAQKIPLKILQKKLIKTYGSYMSKLDEIQTKMTEREAQYVQATKEALAAQDAAL